MSTIFVDFYHGAYGATLLIRIDHAEDSMKLKEIFRSLSNNTISEFDLRDLDNAQFTNVDTLIMTNLSTYPFTKRKGNIIYWEQPETDWYNDEGLMDGLIQGTIVKSGGHQYFGSEDAVIIKISHKEYNTAKDT